MSDKYGVFCAVIHAKLLSPRIKNMQVSMSIAGSFEGLNMELLKLFKKDCELLVVAVSGPAILPK